MIEHGAEPSGGSRLGLILILSGIALIFVGFMVMTLSFMGPGVLQAVNKSGGIVVIAPFPMVLTGYASVLVIAFIIFFLIVVLLMLYFMFKMMFSYVGAPPQG